VISDLTTEFPFVEALPKREAKKIVSVWDKVQDYQRHVEEHGAPIPNELAADLLGISRQRVHQLKQTSGLTLIPLPNGGNAISYFSLREFAKKNRPAGRPWPSSK